MPLVVRCSATDWVEGGWDLAQTVGYAHELKKRGCSLIDGSGGGMTPAQKIPLGPGYQVPFAEAVKRETQRADDGGRMITEADQAEEIIVSEKADIAALARGILYDARWPWHAAVKLGAKLHGPKQYLRAPPVTAKDLFHPAAAG